MKEMLNLGYNFRPGRVFNELALSRLGAELKRFKPTGSATTVSLSRYLKPTQEKADRARDAD